VSERERGEAAEWVASFKVVATDTALRVTAGVFEVTGSRATGRKVGLDRFWRDVRTHSLHDPVAYKNREVGEYVLLNKVSPRQLRSGDGSADRYRCLSLPGIHRLFASFIIESQLVERMTCNSSLPSYRLRMKSHPGTTQYVVLRPYSLPGLSFCQCISRDVFVLPPILPPRTFLSFVFSLVRFITNSRLPSERYKISYLKLWAYPNHSFTSLLQQAPVSNLHCSLHHPCTALLLRRTHNLIAN
jgi:hypothetical protein